MKRLILLVVGLLMLNSQLFAVAPSAEVLNEVDQLKQEGKQKGWTFDVKYNEVLEIPLARRTGFLATQGMRKGAKYVDLAPAASLPSSFDWRDEAKGLPPIKNQGNCGSCWAFGTNFVLEALVKIHTGKVKDLSEQQLVSCSPCGSCNGGNFCHSYQVDPGAALSSDFPYKAKNVACKSGLKTEEKLASWSYIGSGRSNPTVEQVKTAIMKYGPVAVTVAANSSFSSYSKGVYNACNGRKINHLTNIVGWNDDGGYWIMRNSWGSSWGEDGYMRIKYNCNHIANEATFAEYPN